MTTRKPSFVSLLFLAFFVLLPSSVCAKEDWLEVRSKNFYLIGNASEKDIRRVATKLEQFRETFRQVFRSMSVDAPVPTNVVVFKSDASFKQFKPRRGDGKADNLVAGYFQPGEDVNYVTLAADGTDAEMYGVIFHEYVHFLVETNFGKYNVPSWFNEGLAEYYSTFQIEEDYKVKLGYPDGNHLALLLQSKLIPLSDLFNTSPRNYGGGHSRSIFYAQSWALIHYLVQTGKSEGLDKFILGAVTNKPADQVFRDSFGVGYAEMEKELRNYVGRRSFNYHNLTFKNKLVFDTEMKVSPLTEVDSNTYLGDLLFHTNRPDDAEPFLKTALTLDPDSSFANTAMGMVKIKQRKYAEAKAFLERATRDAKNHLAFYRYAELLMREGQDEFGYMEKFEPAAAARMRESLKKAIALKPSFTESYDMLALVSLVTNEHLEEALAGIGTALKHRPGNTRYGMRAAELYLRQNKFKEALSIADKIAKHADEDDVKSRAQQLATSIREREQAIAQYEAERKKFEERNGPSNGGRPANPVRMTRRAGEEAPSPEQVAKAIEAANLRAINDALRKPAAGEARAIGEIEKIDCKGKEVAYTIKTPEGSFQVSSVDFQSLFVMAFVEDGGAEVGCDAKLGGRTAVLSYREDPKVKSPLRGQLVAIEFVPKDFRLIDLNAEPLPPTYIVEDAPPPPARSSSDGAGTSPARVPAAKDYAQERRNSMLQAIAEAIRKPGLGEKRIFGYIEKSECTPKGIFYTFKVGEQILKLSDVEPEATFLKGYTPDIQNLQIGCGMKSVDLPVVVIYKESTDKKPKVAGDVLSLEFVPRSFQLEP